MIHADLKPANVLIGQDGQARLADYGLAKQRRDDDSTRVSLLGARGTPLCE